jgi:hypothetical protein
MMDLKFIFFLLLLFPKPVFSQTKTYTDCFVVPVGDNKNGKVANQVYTCAKFDWQIKIPDGCHVMDLKVIKELEEKGYEAIKKLVEDGKEIKKDPKHLISFGVDNKNLFAATFESRGKYQTMTLEEHRDFATQLYRDSFARTEGVKLKAYSSMISIGNYDFYRIYSKLYDAYSNKLLMTQQIYNCFIGNNLFSVSINYDNEKTGKELVDNFTNSLTK